MRLRLALAAPVRFRLAGSNMHEEHAETFSLDALLMSVPIYTLIAFEDTGEVTINTSMSTKPVST